MGSLVASGLVALSSHQHSLVLAKQKRLANQIADRLLTDWYELRGKIPVREQGRIDASRPWLWQTLPVGSKSVCGLQTDVIRLDILGMVGNDPTPRVLVSIELLQAQNANGLR